MLLINPNFNRSEKCTYYTKWVPMTLPISLAPLAFHLINRGKTAKIFDGNIYDLSRENLEKFLADMSPPYIFGISCVTANINSGYHTAQVLKTMYPGCIVIMGGIHPTVLPDEALNTGLVDIVVRGEGEETLDTLYDRIKNNRSYREVRGISFIDRGSIVHNPAARLFPDLNSIAPFPYHIFGDDIHKYNLSLMLVTRGCPFDCIFCSSRTISGKQYRYVDARKVIEQLDTLINTYDQRYLYFTDDNLVINKKWTTELCERMYEKKYYKKVRFSCSLRGDIVDEEILFHLKRAGFVLLNFGIEAVHDRLLTILKKGETIAEMTRAVTLTKKAGIRTGGTFILGLPTETSKERRETFTWAKKYLDFARFNNACPYPGTELYEIAKNENRLKVGEQWKNLNPIGALVEQRELPYVPLTCTEEELKRDIRQFNYRFWLKPMSFVLLLFEGSPLWFYLPPRWYLNPREWFLLIRLMGKLSIKFIRLSLTKEST